MLDLTLAFHHAVTDDDTKLATDLERLTTLAGTGDYPYYADIAHFMAGLPLPSASTAQWLTDEATVRARWRHLVQARRDR
ncbi:hypothetical protein [Streptomyces diastaticus]